MRNEIVKLSALLAIALQPAVAARALAQAATTATQGHCSVSTTPVGKLLDDPATAEILRRMDPDGLRQRHVPDRRP